MLGNVSVRAYISLNSRCYFNDGYSARCSKGGLDDSQDAFI